MCRSLGKDAQMEPQLIGIESYKFEARDKAQPCT